LHPNTLKSQLGHDEKDLRVILKVQDEKWRLAMDDEIVSIEMGD